MTSKRLIRTTLAATFVAVVPAFGQNILDVPGPLDLSIQEAVDVAESLGVDIIQVAPGTYFESIDMSGVAVELRGSPTEPSQTIIDATGLDDSVIHCTTGEVRTTIIDGFTLIGGAATDRGGGIYCDTSSPLFRNIVVEGNSATGFGGGIYTNDGQPRFVDVTCSANSAPQGGGAYVNAGDSGYPTFLRCNFHDNTANTAGGVHVSNEGSAAFDECRFERNVASSHSGGMRHQGATTRLSRCWFSENTAQNAAGLFAESGTVSMNDSVLCGNVATNHGGAMMVTTPMTLKHGTIAYNEAASSTVNTSSQLTIVNVNMWGNTSSVLINGNPVVSYSNLQALDPLFVDPAGADGIPGTSDDDLRLAAESPVIDAGNSAAVEGQFPVDFDGNPRAKDAPTEDTGFAVLGLTVDMGAFEYQPGPEPVSCPADADDSGAVDFGDILQILSNWGPCPG